MSCFVGFLSIISGWTLPMVPTQLNLIKKYLKSDGISVHSSVIRKVRNSSILRILQLSFFIRFYLSWKFKIRLEEKWENSNFIYNLIPNLSHFEWMNQSFAFKFLCENFQPKLINSYSNFQRFLFSINYIIILLGKVSTLS